MNTTKYLLFGALGVAAVLLLTSDSAKEMRDSLEEKAMKNAKKLKKSLGKLGTGASDSLSELKELLSSEIEGLSDDARERIEGILNGSAKTASKMKKSVTNA